MRPTKDTMTLACVLTDAERLTYSLQMAEALQSLEETEKRKKEYTAQINADIEKFEARSHEIGHKLTSGKEFRTVECKIEYDFEEKTRRWIRLDTFEEAHQDIIPEEMYQEEMALQEKNVQKDQKEAVEKSKKKSKK
jgi:hypothetical protein